MAAEDITVSKQYFLTLLRRAENTYGTQTEDTIEIPISEYDSLRNAAREFEALKNALVAAGTPVESIQILINASIVPTPAHADDDSSSCRTSESYNSCVPAQEGEHSEVWTRSLASQTTKADDKGAPLAEQSILKSETFDDTYKEEEKPERLVHLNDNPGSNYEARSIILRELPVTATLYDVTKAIRGGLLLNVFLRSTNHTAHVAFVEPAAAWHFLEYVKQSDLHIKGKRVSVIWDHKQNLLPPRIARNVYHQGATRNLVIRFPSKEVTAEIIRDDLEHIHCLEVVRMVFQDGHVWISLNSINHALNARSCMMTRKRYKDSRIEFYPDECAQSLPSVIKSSKPSNVIKMKPTAIAFDNRFGVFLAHAKGEDRGSGFES